MFSTSLFPIITGFLFPLFSVLPCFFEFVVDVDGTASFFPLSFIKVCALFVTSDDSDCFCLRDPENDLNYIDLGDINASFRRYRYTPTTMSRLYTCCLISLRLVWMPIEQIC